MYEPRRVSLASAAASIPETRLRPRLRVASGPSSAPPEAATTRQPVESPLPIEAASTAAEVAPAASATPDAPQSTGPSAAQELSVTPTSRKKRRWKKPLALALAGCGLVVAAYLGWLGVSIMDAEGKMYVPRPVRPTATAAQPVALASSSATSVAQAPVGSTATATIDPLSGLPPGRFNILVMGTDKRENDPEHYARSDTMILLNIDPDRRKVRAMTIPRDLVVNIPGYGVNKINSAYLFGEYYQEPGGGQALAADAISQLFNVPIDYYMTINFDGFRKLIDILGGVDIDVPYEIDDYHYPSDDEGDPFGELHVHFDAGLQHMDGKDALRYARTRHADNDFQRSKRQLQVMIAARQSAMSLNLIPRLPSLVNQLGGMIETDIPFDKQLSIARFAYTLHSSDIMTATIDRDLVYPITLDDGSEGLRLDWSNAEPVLDDFFGRSVSQTDYSSSSGATPGATRSKTPARGTATRKVTGTPTRALRATRTPTPPRRTPTHFPTATEESP